LTLFHNDAGNVLQITIIASFAALSFLSMSSYFGEDGIHLIKSRKNLECNELIQFVTKSEDFGPKYRNIVVIWKEKNIPE